MSWFTYFLQLLLLSARLGPAAIAHLVSETGASTILVSTRTKDTANRAISQSSGIDNCPVLATVASYGEFLVNEGLQLRKEVGSPRDNDSPGAVILHSSGTTGLPKPIRLSHRYLVGYAACHRLSAGEALGRLNLSTLPLYHVSIPTRHRLASRSKRG
jgi:acyl-CoA synthetase (AMP-forming)/AMP-acid ligase II